MGDPGAASGSGQLPLPQQSPTQSAFEAGYMAAAQESLQQQQQSGASPNERTPSRTGSGPYMGTHPAPMSHPASDSMGGW